MKTNRKLVLAGILSGVMALVVSAVPVLAAAPTASVVISGDSGGTGLTISSGSNITFAAFTLDGENHNGVVGSGGVLTAIDARGTGAGWHVTVVGSGNFTGAVLTSETIPLANMKATITTATDITRVTGTSAGKPAASSSGVPVAMSTSAQTIVTAAGGAGASRSKDGMGKFTITPAYTLDVPADTYADTYSTTLTVTIVTAP